MRAFSRVLALLLLVSGLASAQGVPGALTPCRMDGSDCAPATGTVTTTGTLASGQVALGSGATSVTSDPGLTGVGTGTGFKLGIGTDVFLSRASAGVLLVEDGSGNARDVQARTVTLTSAIGGLASIGSYGGGGILDLVTGNANTQVRFPQVWYDSGFNQMATTHPAGFKLGGVTVVRGSAAAVLTLGDDDAASPVAQTLQTQGSRGGTDTNVAGGNLTVRPGAGTGSATGSSLIFQTPTATGSGTTAQTQTTRLTLSELGPQWASGTRPTCDATARGSTWYVAGGAGVADTFEVCTKDAGDAYAWRTLQ